MHRNIKRLVQELLWGIDRQTVWTDHQFRSGAFFRTRASISRWPAGQSAQVSDLSGLKEPKRSERKRTERGAPGTTNGTSSALRTSPEGPRYERGAIGRSSGVAFGSRAARHRAVSSGATGLPPRTQTVQAPEAAAKASTDSSRQMVSPGCSLVMGLQWHS